MPDLLLELFSEEIPARMQTQAAEDLRKLVTAALVDRLTENSHVINMKRCVGLRTTLSTPEP